MAVLPIAINFPIYFPKGFILDYQLSSKSSFIWHCTHNTLWTCNTTVMQRKIRKWEKYSEFLQAAFFCEVNLVHNTSNWRQFAPIMPYLFLHENVTYLNFKEIKVTPATVILEIRFIVSAITCINTDHRE